jgi:hypothetical protein
MRPLPQFESREQKVEEHHHHFCKYHEEVIQKDEVLKDFLSVIVFDNKINNK